MVVHRAEINVSISQFAGYRTLVLPLVARHGRIGLGVITHPY